MADWLKGALDYIPSWLELQVRVGRQPGCVIAIAHRGKIVLTHAFGHADCSRGELLTPRHRFRAASHAKAFTAAGILKLQERGKLRLDDPIGKYVSGIDRGIGRLTISQVLCHGAGIIRDGANCGYFYDRRPYPGARELLADFQIPPVIRPDTRFKYSNQGYGLLGLVIERIVGEAYTSWIKREIVDAAGLKETTPDMPVAEGTPFARGHTDDWLLGRRIVVAGDYSTAALAPASGVVTTASDLALFFSQLSPRAATSVISPASRRAMTRRRQRNQHASAQTYYGFGTVSGAVGNWNWFGHSGGLQGYVSRTKVLPAQELTVAVLANSADALVEQWTNGTIHILQTFRQKGRASSKVEDWTGRWWGLWGAIDLVPMGNAVMVANPHAAEPFLNASQLQVTGPDIARIAPSSGFLYYGEKARRTRTGAGNAKAGKVKAGKVKALWLGGDQYLPEAERAMEIEQLSVAGRASQT